MMRLSLAIRLGAMLRPQHFGGVRYVREDSSCVMGAALEAIGYDEQQRGGNLSELWPFLLKRRQCPACGEGPRLPIMFILVHCLNDKHHWTRERIADWVETLEPHAAQPAVEPVEREVEA